MIGEPQGELWDRVKPVSGWIETNEDDLAPLQPAWDNAATAFETAGTFDTGGLRTAWPDGANTDYLTGVGKVLESAAGTAVPVRELGVLAGGFAELVRSSKEAIAGLINDNQTIYQDIPAAAGVAKEHFAQQVAVEALKIMNAAEQAVRDAAGAITPPVVPDLAAGQAPPGAAPESLWDKVQQNADTIAHVGNVLGDVGAALSIVALATSWVPGLNAVTATAALVVNGAALGTQLLAKAAGGNVSWGSIGVSALGVIPGGKIAGAVLPAGRYLAPGAINAVRLGAMRQFGGAAGKWLTKPTPFVKYTNGGPVNLRPPTLDTVMARPIQAIEHAATYTHAKNIALADKATFGKFNLDVTSTAGHVAGAVVGGAKRAALGAAKRFGIEQADQQLQELTR